MTVDFTILAAAVYSPKTERGRKVILLTLTFGTGHELEGK